MQRSKSGLPTAPEVYDSGAECGGLRQGKKGFRRAFLASSVILGFLAACASVPVQEPGDLVAARARDRWQALIDKDIERAYKFLSEGTRQAISLERYQSSIKSGIWRKVEVDAVQCKESVCKVRLLITYDHKVMKGVTTPLSETWLIENGNAWFVLTQ